MVNNHYSTSAFCNYISMQMLESAILLCKGCKNDDTAPHLNPPPIAILKFWPGEAI